MQCSQNDFRRASSWFPKPRDPGFPLAIGMCQSQTKPRTSSHQIIKRAKRADKRHVASCCSNGIRSITQHFQKRSQWLVITYRGSKLNILLKHTKSILLTRCLCKHHKKSFLSLYYISYSRNIPGQTYTARGGKKSRREAMTEFLVLWCVCSFVHLAPSRRCISSSMMLSRLLKGHNDYWLYNIAGQLRMDRARGWHAGSAPLAIRLYATNFVLENALLKVCKLTPTAFF